MEVTVKENDAIRSQYFWAKFRLYMYIIPLILFFAGLATRDIYWIIPFTLPLFLFGYAFLRPLRISSFSDDTFTSSWPREGVRRYDAIRRIINLSPYEESCSSSSSSTRRASCSRRSTWPGFQRTKASLSI